MSLAKGSTLLVAALMDAPALWQAFGTHQLDPSTALLRYLIAVPISAALLGILRAVTAPYLPKPPDPADAVRAMASRLDGEEQPAANDGMVKVPLPTTDRRQLPD